MEVSEGIGAGKQPPASVRATPRGRGKARCVQGSEANSCALEPTGADDAAHVLAGRADSVELGRKRVVFAAAGERMPVGLDVGKAHGFNGLACIAIAVATAKACGEESNEEDLLHLEFPCRARPALL